MQKFFTTTRLFTKPLNSSLSHRFSSSNAPKDGPLVTVKFFDKEGNLFQEVKEPVGTSILEVAHKHGVDLEGACEGSCACSTCHVVVKQQDMYDKLPEASDDENDMLDLAFGLTETSRLGCQIKLTEDIDGIELQLPAATRNMAVDGFKPKPH